MLVYSYVIYVFFSLSINFSWFRVLNYIIMCKYLNLCLTTAVFLFSSTNLRRLTEQWRYLYRCFIALTPLASNVAANVEADHLSRQILSILGSDKLAGPPDLHANTLNFSCSAVVQIASRFRYCRLGKSAPAG